MSTNLAPRYPVASNIPAKVVLEPFVVHPETFDYKVTNCKNSIILSAEARSLSEIQFHILIKATIFSVFQLECFIV